MFVFTINGSDYAYLLGLYLGDGCVAKTTRSYQMVITLDARYPGLVVECAETLERISPNKV